MALSKLTFLTHLKTLTTPRFHRHPPPFITLRFLSFATPEEAAAERRRRKRRLRIEPPLSSLHRSQQPQQQLPPKPIQNPNAPKLPETLAAVCRPTIFTVNAVMTAQLRQSKYSDLLSLHRFITQAGVAPNVITYNLLFQTYLDCKKPDTALEHYKQFINDAPFNPSPTTYRILIKGLVDNGKLEKAMELKEEMLAKGIVADPVVYSYLMMGCVRNDDSDGVFRLYEELKEKLGMEEEAMMCYNEAVGENSSVKMSAVAYNNVLDALCKNGKFDEALKLFDRMIGEHNPPKRLAVNLGSFNVMADGYCAEGRFEEAIEVFRKMGEYRCSPDTLSFNNLIDQLCKNGMLGEAEKLYGEMGEKGVNPDEYTYGVLMDTCFKEDRVDDGAAYFRKMIETGLRPNLAVYNRLVDQLVKVGNIDEAKSFFDIMVKKLKMDDASYKFIMKALKLGKEGREEDLVKLMEEKERQKAEAKAKEAEAAEAAKKSASAAISSLIPSKLFGKKEGGAENPENANAVEASSADSIGETEAGKEENVEEATAIEAALANSEDQL
ncbi:hypothetical protein Pint_05038 [Pistacia integerrima]|uniref:Uncharacterized protein n=1 Tax=Pistacia integerrima TaxID=434235 RepID=A0ACC0Z6G6_9ROSI|nr:hypothetical protein Pint_05038 [Pistacia integerrima]